MFTCSKDSTSKVKVGLWCLQSKSSVSVSFSLPLLPGSFPGNQTIKSIATRQNDRVAVCLAVKVFECSFHNIKVPACSFYLTSWHMFSLIEVCDIRLVSVGQAVNIITHLGSYSEWHYNDVRYKNGNYIINIYVICSMSWHSWHGYLQTTKHFQNIAAYNSFQYIFKCWIWNFCYYFENLSRIF